MSALIKPRSNLRQRVYSGVVLVVIVLFAVYWGGLIFSELALLLGAAVYYEWLGMIHADATGRAYTFAWIGYGLFALAVILAGPSLSSLIILLAASLAVYFVFTRLKSSNSGKVAIGLFCFGLVVLALASIRQLPQGATLIVFLFFVVWATDIAAYFAGRHFGGAKLAPSISPNKTWSGAIGGLVCATLVGFVIAVNFLNFTVFAAIIFAVILSIVSQLGDLFESSLKRRFEIKDSGGILPGHGGVFDRVDGLLPASLVLFVLLSIF